MDMGRPRSKVGVNIPGVGLWASKRRKLTEQESQMQALLSALGCGYDMVICLPSCFDVPETMGCNWEL